MAITTRIVKKGPTNFVLHVFLEQDGVIGELNNHVLVEPAELGLPAGPSLRLVEAWHSFATFDAVLKWGGVTPRPMWVFAKNAGLYVDFSRVGFLVDMGAPAPSDDDGKILLSTKGFVTDGSYGSMVLAFRR